jgi:hypothetical protein
MNPYEQRIEPGVTRVISAETGLAGIVDNANVAAQPAAMGRIRDFFMVNPMGYLDIGG